MSDSLEVPAPPKVSTLGQAVARRRLRAALLGEVGEPVLVDRFALQRELGHGGMGTVWLAHDAQLDRQVALKFLHRETESETTEQRLFAEAQSLAKISHPNVVPVYDVGRHEGRVWVAMEFVPGQTLRRWVAHQQPTHERSLEAWRDAGRGLAAVHAAGLVHRDVKPDNVMLGDDGRVRLVDFGLVRSAAVEQSEDTRTESGWDTHSGTSKNGSDGALGGERLTRTRQFVGTPAYAAPEQRRHQPVDARADQYSFCVSVWEALTGSRPRRDDAQSVVLENSLTTRVRQALVRGLSLAPEDRFADMDGLLDALTPRRRVWVLPALSAVIAGGLGLSTAMGSDEPDPCAAAGVEIAETWSDPQREALAARFSEPVASHATRVLDQWASEWSTTARDSCEDVHVRGLYSTDALDRRGACLEQAHGQLASLLESLEQGQLTRTPDLVTWLGDLDAPARCSSPAVLDARYPRPEPAQEQELAPLRRELRMAELGVQPVAIDERIDVARRIYGRTVELEWMPLSGRAALAMGKLHLMDGRSALARTWYGQALDHGQQLRDLDLLIRAQHGLGQVELLLEFDADGAQWRLDRETTLVRQWGDPPSSVAEMLANEGYLHRLRGDQPAAQDALQRSVEAWERAGPRHVWGLATGLRRLADVLDEGGHADESLALLERARRLEQLDELTGALPVERHESAFNEGITAMGTGDLATAETKLRAALDAAIQRQGPRGRLVAQAHVALAGVFDATGDLEAARAHARAADDIASTTLAPDHPERIPALTALGLAEFRAGRFEAAAAIYRRALIVGEARLPPDSPDLAVQHLNLGETLYEQGKDEPAREHLERALAVFERTLPAEHPFIAVTLKALGSVELRRGDGERARTWLLRAASIFEATPSSRVEHAEVRWRLAQAEAAVGSLDAARAEAEAAAAAFEALGEDWTDRVTEIRRWASERHDDSSDNPGAPP